MINRPDKLEMRGHASVLSPANDTLAHRIQGRDLDAHFEAGELTTVDVIGNGEVNYFEVPEGNAQAMVRLNAAKCAQVHPECHVDRKLTAFRPDPTRFGPQRHDFAGEKGNGSGGVSCWGKHRVWALGNF